MAKSRIAEAYVQIVPTMDGAATAISSEMGSAGAAGAQAFSGNFTKGLAGIAGAVGAAFAVGSIANFTGTLVQAAEAEVEQNRRIQNIAQSMGLFGGETNKVVGRLLEFASQQQLQNGLDEDAIKITQAKLLTFRNLATTAGEMGGLFDRATMAAQDLAAAGFGSAESNAVALGKALNDPIKGITALSRMGVTFSEDQKAMIESMVETGNIAGAQEAIMAELERQVGGTAAAISTNADKLDASWQNLQETLGLALLPVVESFAGAVKPVADWFANTPGAVEGLITVVAVFTGVMAALAAVFVVATIQTWAMNAALLANPITWIVLGIVAAVGLLAGIIILLVNNWDAFIGWVQSVFGPVFEWLGGIFTWLWEEAIKPVVDGIVNAFTWLWETIILPVVQAIVATIIILGAIFDWLYNIAIKPMLDAIGKAFEWVYENIIQPVVDKVVAVIEGLGAIFDWLYKNAVKPAFDGVAMAFEWIYKNIILPVVNFINSAIETVGDTVETVFGAIGGFIQSAFEGVVGLIRGPVNAVIDFINGAINGINKIKIDIPEWAQGLFGGAKKLGFNIPNIPKLAEGGYVDSPTFAMIGEAGPEVVTPLRDFERMMGMNNGGAGVVNYYAAPNQSLDSEEALVKALSRAKVLASW